MADIAAITPTNIVLHEVEWTQKPPSEFVAPVDFVVMP